MAIAKGAVVAMHYDLKDKDGNLIESTKGSKPLEFLAGYNNILPKLENKIMESNVGDKFTLTLAPEDAYGEYDKGQVRNIPRNSFPDTLELQIGMQLMADMGDHQLPFTVKEINEDEVLIDFNHPMAGTELTFDVEITGMRAATDVELEHGHIHAVSHDGCGTDSCDTCGGH